MMAPINPDNAFRNEMLLRWWRLAWTTSVQIEKHLMLSRKREADNGNT